MTPNFICKGAEFCLFFLSELRQAGLNCRRRDCTTCSCRLSEDQLIFGRKAVPEEATQEQVAPFRAERAGRKAGCERAVRRHASKLAMSWASAASWASRAARLRGTAALSSSSSSLSLIAPARRLRPPRPPEPLQHSRKRLVSSCDPLEDRGRNMTRRLRSGGRWNNHASLVEVGR